MRFALASRKWSCAAVPKVGFYGDYINHPDHRAAGVAALEAVFPRAEMELFWPEEGPVHKVHAVYVHGTTEDNVAVDVTGWLEVKVAALKLHKSQLGDWDPTEMIEKWATEEAKAFRKRMKKQGVKVKADDGSKLTCVETFRVMTLVDQPQESVIASRAAAKQSLATERDCFVGFQPPRNDSSIWRIHG